MGGNRINVQQGETANLTPLRFPRSDGDPTRRPPNVDPTPDASGEVNYHRLVPLVEFSSVAWRTKSAAAVATHLGKSDPHKFIFEDWPEHYEFFDHNKGAVENPRHDLYLYGSVQKFRSVNEFVPHAIWLMTDETLNRTNCKCKYCTKSKSQTDISKAHGLLLHSGPGKVDKSEVGSDFRPAFVPLKRKEPPRQVCSHDRVSDLRAHRWFREAEVVWCALAPALGSSLSGSSTAPSPSLQFWPGIIQEPNVKVYTTSSGPVDAEQQYAVHFESHQRWTYKIKLLGLEQMVFMPEVAILPYQSYQPPESLLAHLSRAPKMKLESRVDMRRISGLCVHTAFVPLKRDQDPFAFAHVPKGYASTLEEVATALTLAIEIAAQLTRLWTATDQWQFQGIVKNPEDNGNELTLSETRFQGIWWGAERIWQEDMVRLKMRRSALAQHGDTRVLPPTAGAEDRAVLMRIVSIFHDPTVNQCRISGMLYEMAQEGWGKKHPDLARLGLNEQTSRLNRLPYDGLPSESPSKTPSSPNHPSTSNNAPDGRRPIPSTSKRIFMTPPPSPAKPPLTHSSPSRLMDNLTSVSVPTVPAPPSPPRQVMSPRLQPMALLNASENESALSYPSPLDEEALGSNQFRFAAPSPPEGFVFRPILKADQEVWMDLSFLAGRYYTGLLEAKLLTPFLHPNGEGSSSTSVESTPMNIEQSWAFSGMPASPARPGPRTSFDSSQIAPPSSGEPSSPKLTDAQKVHIRALRALAGLAPGYLNAVDACQHKVSRYHMVRHADMQARWMCHEAWHRATGGGGGGGGGGGPSSDAGQMVIPPLEEEPEPEMPPQDRDETMGAAMMARRLLAAK